jgi:hypothetical protein
MDEGDIWTAEKSASEWAKELTDFDYVVILNTAGSFATEFGGLFENVAEVSDATVFSVESSGGEVSLVGLP